MSKKVTSLRDISAVNLKSPEYFYIYIGIPTHIKLSGVDERDLSHTVLEPTFLSLSSWRQVSETQLTKTITGPKSRGISFGTKLWRHVQRYCFIDRMHKWRPKKYSFVFVLISLTSLVSTDKIQKKSSLRTRLVGLISTKTKEYFFRRHLCIRSMKQYLWTWRQSVVPNECFFDSSTEFPRS